MPTGPDRSGSFRVLLLEANPESLASVCSAWPDAETVVTPLVPGLGVADLVSRERVKMVVCELDREAGPGNQALQQIRRVHPHLPLLAILPEQGFALAVSAFRDGANDVLTQPLNEEMLEAARERAASREDLGAGLARAQQLAERSLDDLILLKAIGESTHSIEDQQKLLDRIVDLIQSALDVDIVSLMMADDDGCLRIRATRGLPDDVRKKVVIASGEGVSGHVLAKGEPVLIDDLSTDGRFPPREGVARYRTGSLLSVPIRYKQHTMGVLNVNNKRNGEAFSGTDQELLMMIAHQTALALENVKLVGRLQEKNLEVENTHADLVKLHNDRTRFVCNLSHELKTPLTSVLGYADLLVNFFDQFDESQVREYIASVYSEGRHLEHLLTGMLRLFSIDSGSENWDWEKLSLKDCIAHTLLQHEARVDELGLDLVLNLSDETLPIWGDRDKVGILLDALIDNAIKFNRPEGRLLISTDNMQLHGKPMVYLQVVNQGVSVPRERAEDIFQEYSQLGALDAGKPSGVGVGLATCRAILRQMEGDIFLEPFDGEGTAIGLLLATGNDD